MTAPDDDSRHTAIREDVAQLFRAEALEQYQRGQVDEAHLLEVEPRWMRYADRIILALLAAALLVGLLMTLPVPAHSTGDLPQRHGGTEWDGETERFVLSDLCASVVTSPFARNTNRVINGMRGLW